MSDAKRLFLAVNLSITTTRKIAETVDQMRPIASRQGLRVAWVPPANLHVTLKFLGWSSPEAVGAIGDLLAVTLLGRKAFEVEACGVGAFPSEASARILWAGLIDAAGALAGLANELDASMETLGYPLEQRAFHPHVTLGRVKEGHGVEDVLRPFGQMDFGTSMVREVVVYESKLREKGSEYTALVRAPFAGPR